MNRKHLATWIGLTAIFGGLGLLFASATWHTILIGLLVYLPLTGGVVWLTVYRHRAWFGLWFLVFLGWLTYLGPL